MRYSYFDSIKILFPVSFGFFHFERESAVYRKKPRINPSIIKDVRLKISVYRVDAVLLPCDSVRLNGTRNNSLQISNSGSVQRNEIGDT